MIIDNNHRFVLFGMEIGILGGGIAGLTLAHNLGINSKIIEKESELGGLARSYKFDGFTFDRGSHIIFSRNKIILNWMLERIKTNKTKNKRNTKINYKGKFVKYPFENDLVSIPLDDRYDCVIGYINQLINLKESKAKGEVIEHKNFGEWIVKTFGEGIAEHYMFPYNRKVWCMDPFEMSAHWMEDRIPMPPPEDVIKSALGIQTEGYTHQLNFYYPKDGGIQGFSEGIKKELESEICLNEEVEKIRKIGNKWTVETSRTIYSFDYLFNTMPLYILNNVMDLPNEVSNAISGLISNSAWLVMLGFDNENIGPWSWMYIPDEEILCNRISFPNNFSQNTSPEGKSSILIEITCMKDDEIWKMDEHEIIERSINDLMEVNVIKNRDEICFQKAIRTPLAYVVYDLNYLHNIEIINKYFDEIGLINVGRFAEFVYYNMDGVIQSALEKSEILLKEINN